MTKRTQTQPGLKKMNNTINSSITEKMISMTKKIEIISGEGEEGAVEEYKGPRTVKAIRALLTKERCNGDRWAVLVLDGRRI